MRIYQWFEETPLFDWYNCSVPSHDSCRERTKKGLKECLSRQISRADAVIVIAGMYVAYREWIQYEIEEAMRMEKVIIGIRPWGSYNIPRLVQEAA